MNPVVRNIYRVVRSILFSAIVAVAALYLIVYVTVSVPAVQDKIRSEAETELSRLFGGQLTIGHLDFYPFNEAVLTDVSLADPQGRQCINVKRLGAGINLWRLITRREIEITYAELIYPDVKLWKATADSPLNIQFLIDALSPKDKKKPPTKFNLQIHSVVMREGRFSFDKQWIAAGPADKIDFNHIRLAGISADIELPRLKNDDFTVDLRRLAFEVPGLLTVEKIGCKAHITPRSLSVNSLIIQLPGSDIRPSDIALNFNVFKEIPQALSSGSHSLYMLDSKITPYDFRGFLPQLSAYSDPFILDVEVSGNINDVNISRLSLRSADSGMGLALKGKVQSLGKIQNLRAIVDEFRLLLPAAFNAKTLRAFQGIPEKVVTFVQNAGDIKIDLNGYFSMADRRAQADGAIVLSSGDLRFSLDAANPAGRYDIEGEVSTNSLNLGKLLAIDKIGILTMQASGHAVIAGRDFQGNIDLDVPSVQLNGRNLTNLTASVSKKGSHVLASAFVDDPSVGLDLNADATVAGPGSSLSLQADMRHLRPTDYFPIAAIDGYTFSGNVSVNLSGSNIDNVNGNIRLTDFSATGGARGDISLHNFSLEMQQDESYRSFNLNSDWLQAFLEGDFVPSRLPALVQGMLSEALPTLVAPPRAGWREEASGAYRIQVYENSDLTQKLHLPLHWYSDIVLSGNFSGNPGTFTLTTSLPYLRQGADKLIRDIGLDVSLDERQKFASLVAGCIYPTKKGDLRLDIDLQAIADRICLNADFNKDRNVSFYGSLGLDALFKRNLVNGALEGSLHIQPSSFFLNKAEWKLNEADIEYADRELKISNFNLRHGAQFVDIQGIAGADPEDTLDLGLANIDLQYIFDTLNINYVSFGGIATGELTASNIFSRNPKAQTKRLLVKDLTYNGAVLGDGDISSHWDNERKCVTIDALIDEKGRRTVDMKGGIWVTRDSLSFDFDADKVNVAFLQPFMGAFATKFEGRASGRALLYGTFKDIDLKGDLFADTVALKLGFTNVTYSGSDSVKITPGHIRIPHFTLHDKFGNKAQLSGTLTHRYFHEPSFDFRITKVEKLLCYDTNQRLNPDWWGTIFASGTAAVVGRPGYVEVSANMVTNNKSTFTFVLNDRQDADDYHFLTFTDRKREEEERKKEEEEPEYMKLIRRNKTEAQGPPTIFAMNLRVDVTPQAALTLVMDPVAGDKIRAHGSGSLNLGYNSSSDEMSMYGKYTLDDGTYNFSLQDLILKDFKIRPGSTISFNGDPLDASLNISAAYRVNTNLTDLDKSFANDKELNRTNVPVDAVLNVTGDMTSPNVTFDIDLPTLTEETARKVRSIISTEDMMSRQIIYLLALNRFYTPEYMGISSNGGEWASVASSTLSSQLSSMLGQLTDKVNVMPSLRSDKGDFSDVEVDVALSSRLLNNRLLINGNFGYRDHSTSNTTFVGDFDIEYLLNSNGNLRLKAYNHFNDQNYYLRSALTTQGLGIIYRKEFDNPFTFLRRKKKPEHKAPADSVPQK